MKGKKKKKTSKQRVPEVTADELQDRKKNPSVLMFHFWWDTIYWRKLGSAITIYSRRNDVGSPPFTPEVFRSAIQRQHFQGILNGDQATSKLNPMLSQSRTVYTLLSDQWSKLPLLHLTLIILCSSFLYLSSLGMTLHNFCAISTWNWYQMSAILIWITALTIIIFCHHHF